MLDKEVNVSSYAYKVGYESSSQFGREYGIRARLRYCSKARHHDAEVASATPDAGLSSGENRLISPGSHPCQRRADGLPYLLHVAHWRRAELA